MIVYNITSKVHYSADADWLAWQRTEYIPAMMATGFFNEYQLMRLLDQDDSEGNTYAVRFTSASEDQFQQYLQLHAPTLRKKAVEKWGERVISFRSVLKVL